MVLIALRRPYRLAGSRAGRGALADAAWRGRDTVERCRPLSCALERRRHFAAAPGSPTKRPGRFSDQFAGRVASTDREFLSGVGAQQVLIHDYRDMKFLKRLSAIGIAGSLMSSSALAYAVSIGLAPVWCGLLVLQTSGSAFMLLTYLRTYVARAVLDPRRGRLSITGCSLFGDPLTEETHLQLAFIEPGPTVTDTFIKFRLKGASMDPSSYLWYRIPRAQPDGKAAGGAVQLGMPTVGRAPRIASASSAAAAIGEPAKTQKRFRGAGLGLEEEAEQRRSVPTAPTHGGTVSAERRQMQKLAEATKKAAEAEAASAAAKSLASLRLHEGLPAGAEEEAKLLEFLEDPSAYANQIR
eukprot:TRINITY_DN59399_c0_g1_i1.p1 TRINITY_DN59399_c0_g1~~TRINITY_DN59399_c0_g1_i1.p1  ORF type:complete len:355 (+),score=63.12 TRINITY_DN59399_c0_g1_i1:68-1132(+)